MAAAFIGCEDFHLSIRDLRRDPPLGVAGKDRGFSAYYQCRTLDSLYNVAPIAKGCVAKELWG